ncbi:MAG: VOC family protein [Kiloniellales bacterium]
MALHGIITHVEIGTDDAEAAARFFSDVFGWRFVTAPDGNGEGWFEIPGGKIGLHGGNPGFGLVPYLRVDDIDLAVARVRKQGGEAEDVVTEEGWGQFSNCRDPQGLRFGLHQPD